MSYRWIGALLVIAGCGGFGFSMASEYVREEMALRQLCSGLDYMFCELRCNGSALPQICQKIGSETRGAVGRIFRGLSEELEACPGPCAAQGMETALGRVAAVPPKTAELCRELGSTLGRFDLEGQLSALDAVRTRCRQALEEMNKARSNRVRTYETLGLCAGAALAIILI